MRELRVAIVHDFLVQHGGAERVLESIHRLFPSAPVFTLVHDPKKLPAFYRTWDLRPHPRLRWLGNLGTFYKALFFIYPWFVESFDLSDYDLVISSSYAYAHGVRFPKDSVHVCYCHTPMRFSWEQASNHRERIPLLLRFLYDRMIGYLRAWDLRASKRPTQYLANSAFIARQIQRFYGRKAEVVFPPLSMATNPTILAREDFFLVVTRLVRPHKRVDLAIEAANRLGFELRIVGEGTDRKYFESLAGPTVHFLGRVTDEQLALLYQSSRALILSWEEDFGIAPLEANAFGTPVVAYRRGGALETQVDGETAIFFDNLTVDSLVDTIQHFQTLKFDSKVIRKRSEVFSEANFHVRILALIEEVRKQKNESLQKAG